MPGVRGHEAAKRGPQMPNTAVVPHDPLQNVFSILVFQIGLVWNIWAGVEPTPDQDFLGASVLLDRGWG